MHSAYELAWLPVNVPADSPITKIELRSRGTHVHLIYPHLHIVPVLPQQQTERLDAADKGLLTPLSANAIKMGARVVEQARQPMAWVSFDSRTVALENRLGSEGGLLDVIFAYYGSAGERMPAGQWATVEIKPKRNASAFISEQFRTFSEPLRVPPGAKTLRILIRDANTGTMGSTTVTL